MENGEKKFADRLRTAMEKAGYEPKPAVLEREYNLRCWDKPMTLHGVRRWLRGETIPGQEKLLVLAEWLRISPQQLRYGTEIDQKITARLSNWEEAINYREREVIEAFLNLPAEQKQAIKKIILALSDSGKKIGSIE